MNDDTIEADFVSDDLTPEAFPVGGPMEAAGTGVPQRGTLDESIFRTFKRDIIDINSRLKQVVYPKFLIKSEGDAASAASRCDLWAPLTFIILYAVAVSPRHANTLFSSLFVSQWFVLLIMAVHLRLTKPYSKTSLISYISLSGYCLFPQVVNAVISRVLLPLLLKATHNAPWCIRTLVSVRVCLLGLCLYWSVSSISLVTASNNFIEIYPLALCFFAIGWLTVIL